MTAHEGWLEYSNAGGALTFAEWCQARDEAEALRVRVRAVLDDAELLAAVLAAVRQAGGSSSGS